MKQFLFALLLGLPMAASAMIGETLEQCTARYGKPTRADSDGSKAAYKKAGLIIYCEFFEGKCAAVEYYKEEEDALGSSLPLSAVEIQTLRDGNAPAQSWKEQPVLALDLDIWETDTLMAISKKIINPMFKVVTKEQVNRDDATRASKERENMAGLVQSTEDIAKKAEVKRLHEAIIADEKPQFEKWLTTEGKCLEVTFQGDHDIAVEMTREVVPTTQAAHAKASEFAEQWAVRAGGERVTVTVHGQDNITAVAWYDRGRHPEFVKTFNALKAEIDKRKAEAAGKAAQPTTQP